MLNEYIKLNYFLCTLMSSNYVKQIMNLLEEELVVFAFFRVYSVWEEGGRSDRI
jgi:hypothetical protein